MSLIYFFIFCLGAVIGSFLNVVSLRFNTGRSFVKGRSGCFSCGKQLVWYENIPIVSFLVLRGRCSGCKTKISFQYPIVECATGLLFLFGFLKFEYLLQGSLWPFLVAYTLFILPVIFLILIFLHDLKHKIIPNEFVYPFIILGGISLFFGEGIYNTPSLFDAMAGPILFLPFFTLWFVSGGRWMGFADGKLAWGIGWMLGLAHGASAIILGFWIGALWAICALVFQKIGLFSGASGLTMKSEIPFGPFLIVGFLIILCIPFDFFSLESLIVFYEIGL